jgi:hypothetical protein
MVLGVHRLDETLESHTGEKTRFVGSQQICMCWRL